MTLTQLKVLLTIVETGSFSRAAEILNISQPGISHSISGLEKELGVKLLERKSKNVTLTELGRSMLPKMREMLRLQEQIMQEASAWIGGHLGKIRIGCFSSVLVKWLPDLINTFQKQYAGIELSVIEGTYEEITEWVQTGAIDVGFLSLPCPQLEQITLTQDEYVLVLPPTHRLGSRTEIAIEEISREPFIMPNAGCQTAIAKMFQDQGLSSRVLFEIRDTMTILHMVQQGTGITILPTLALPAAMPDVQVKQLHPQTGREIGLVVRSMSSVSPATKVFISHTQKWVEEKTKSHSNE